MDDLEQLIRLGKETKSLDYKGPCNWSEGDRKACCELVKDALAMANSGGGFIVFGVSEGPAGFTLEGMSRDMAATFEATRFNRFLQNYAGPPINCTIIKKTVNSKTFIVLEVPAFRETPHLCQKDFPGVLQAATLYIRSDNNESAPVRSSADFRAVIERAVRNQGDRLLESMRAILTGSSQHGARPESVEHYREEITALRGRAELVTRYNDSVGGPKYRGFRETWSYPGNYDSNRFSLGQLREMAQRASGEFRGRPFLVVGSSGIESPKAVDGGLEGGHRFSDFLEQDRADFWHIGYSGLLFQRVLMWEESFAEKNNLPPLLDLREFAMYTAEALTCVCSLYESGFSPDEPIQVNIQVTGTNGRRLALTGRGAMPLSQTYVSPLKEVGYAATKSLADWRAGLVDHAVSICDFVFQRFNWTQPNLGLCRKTVEDLLARRLY